MMLTLKLHLLVIKMIFMQNYNRQKIVTMRMFVLISTLCMIPAAFIQIIIDDRVSESLHLQIISGLKKKTYWIAQFTYDMVLYEEFSFIQLKKLKNTLTFLMSPNRIKINSLVTVNGRQFPIFEN